MAVDRATRGGARHAYGNRAAVEVSDENDRFTVSLRFPLEEGEA